VSFKFNVIVLLYVCLNCVFRIHLLTTTWVVHQPTVMHSLMLMLPGISDWIFLMCSVSVLNINITRRQQAPIKHKNNYILFGYWCRLADVKGASFLSSGILYLSNKRVPWLEWEEHLVLQKFCTVTAHYQRGNQLTKTHAEVSFLN